MAGSVSFLPYKLIVEKPYCCVPAVLQMILERRRLPYQSQDEIGSRLGLIVPPELASCFASIRAGPEPLAGYGTEISKPQFSIERYFSMQQIPLKVDFLRAETMNGLRKTIVEGLQEARDIVICYDSQALFGEGDREHVSLVQSINEQDELVVIDPAIGAPLCRFTTIEKLFAVLTQHDVSNLGGIWIFSPCAETACKND